ncbi:hypothetical protein D3C86_900540 [compost metagenome]
MQLPVQRAPRHIQQPRQRLRRGGLAGARAQQFAHALAQQAVAAVLQHRERQGALEHGAQRALVAQQRQREVALVEADAGLRRVEVHVGREHQRVGVAVRRRRERKGGLAQRDARVDGPAHVAVHEAQAGHQAELAERRVERAVLGDAQRGHAAGHLQRERDVLGQQAVVAAPAFHGHAQVGRGERGAAQHAVAAPGQAAREPAQRLVVQLLHRVARQRLELRGRHPRARAGQFARRDLCRLQGLRRVLAVAGIPLHDGSHEGHRRDGAGGSQEGGGRRGGGHRSWRNLQPLWRQLRRHEA